MPAGESARAMSARLRTEAERLLSDAERWAAGAEGEERVGALLDTADRNTTRVLHDRLLKPGTSEANLDHLVVSPAGVHLVDAKNWIGDVTIYEGSLWQHWTTSDGRQTACKNEELYKVWGMAAAVQKIIGRTVTPVLCLAGPGAEKLEADEPVKGVHVVAAQRLMSWLQSQPQAMPVDGVATLAVQMSVTFPPAIGDPLRTELANSPVVEPPRERRRPSSTRRTRVRTPRHKPLIKAIVALAALVVLAIFGSQIASGIGKGATKIADNAAGVARTTSPAASPSPSLTPRQLQALDDWRIRAGQYQANAKPSVLPYVPDSGLGAYKDQCHAQEDKLVAFRHGLIAAPDPQLAAGARHYDVAAHQYLEACRKNRPVALHHAEGAMSVAASEVNLRYNRLLARDPAAYNATRVLQEHPRVRIATDAPLLLGVSHWL